MLWKWNEHCKVIITIRKLKSRKYNLLNVDCFKRFAVFWIAMASVTEILIETDAIET